MMKAATDVTQEIVLSEAAPANVKKKIPLERLHLMLCMQKWSLNGHTSADGAFWIQPRKAKAFLILELTKVNVGVPGNGCFWWLCFGPTFHLDQTLQTSAIRYYFKWVLRCVYVLMMNFDNPSHSSTVIMGQSSRMRESPWVICFRSSNQVQFMLVNPLVGYSLGKLMGKIWKGVDRQVEMHVLGYSHLFCDNPFQICAVVCLQLKQSWQWTLSSCLHLLQIWKHLM